MLYLFGRYRRERALPMTYAVCPRCGYNVRFDWMHRYKTIHFFFFPLFSFGHEVMAKCSYCPHEVVSPHPAGPPKMPLLDRMGILFPVGLVGAGVVGLVVLLGVAVATAPPPKPDSEAYRALNALEFDMALGKTNATGPGAQELADAVFDALLADQYAKAEIAVGARVTDRPAGEPKGHVVLVVVEYSQLSALAAAPRTTLAKQLHDVVAPKLADADRAVVIVKGSLLEGVLMSGEANDEWPIEVQSSIPKEDLEKALASHPVDAGAPVASASASASAPVPSASAAPSASPAPPKKKKKKSPAPPAN